MGSKWSKFLGKKRNKNLPGDGGDMGNSERRATTYGRVGQKRFDGHPDTMSLFQDVCLPMANAEKKADQVMQCLLRSYPNPDEAVSGTETGSPR
jgi:hypothetical protein